MTEKDQNDFIILTQKKFSLKGYINTLIFIDLVNDKVKFDLFNLPFHEFLFLLQHKEINDLSISNIHKIVNEFKERKSNFKGNI